MRFRIYYAGGAVVEGRGRAAWAAAPDEGVQVVVRFPMRDGLRWSSPAGPVRDRDLWTGTDTYDPFGWGEKRGALMERAEYDRIWERACGDSYP